MSTTEYLNWLRYGLLKYKRLSMTWAVIFKPNLDNPSDSLLIQNKRICISFVFSCPHLGDLYVNTDQKRSRYSGVDKAYIRLSMPFWNTECTHLNDVDHMCTALIGVSHHDWKFLYFKLFCWKSVTGFYSCIHILDRGDKQTKWISLNKIWSVGLIIWQNIALKIITIPR